MKDHAETNAKGRIGVTIAQLLFERLGFMFRRDSGDTDHGIDAYIELMDADSNATGNIIALQIKAGASYFKAQSDTAYIFRGTAKHLKYWVNHSLPVLIVLVDIERDEAFWQHVIEPITTKSQKGWKIAIPMNHRVNETAMRALYKIASSRGKTWIGNLITEVSKPNNLPFAPNPFFCGREEILQRLSHSVSSKRIAVLTQSMTVHGQGGIGKTQTAIQFAWTNESHFSALLWLSAESPQTFRSGLASLAKEGVLDLGLKFDADVMGLHFTDLCFFVGGNAFVHRVPFRQEQTNRPSHQLRQVSIDEPGVLPRELDVPIKAEVVANEDTGSRTNAGGKGLVMTVTQANNIAVIVVGFLGVNLHQTKIALAFMRQRMCLMANAQVGGFEGVLNLADELVMRDRTAETFTPFITSISFCLMAEVA